jgi:hypothetical protein
VHQCENPRIALLPRRRAMTLRGARGFALEWLKSGKPVIRA